MSNSQAINYSDVNDSNINKEVVLSTQRLHNTRPIDANLDFKAKAKVKQKNQNI